MATMKVNNCHGCQLEVGERIIINGTFDCYKCNIQAPLDGPVTYLGLGFDDYKNTFAHVFRLEYVLHCPGCGKLVLEGSMWCRDESYTLDAGTILELSVTVEDENDASD